MTSAPFALHCMICFEAFDLKEHAPVVLPCGHTYLCHCCSKRLEKCMECRTSLFHAPASNSIASSPPVTMMLYRNSPTTYGGRMSPSPRLTPTTPVRTFEKLERLPTPKNHVLIDLIESSIYAEKRRKEEEDEDEDQVKEGIRQLNSNCGTYVVREPLGLIVEMTPEDVKKSDVCDKENQTCLIEEEKSTKEETEIYAPDSFDSYGDAKAEGGLRIHYGQTVQVVSFEDGIAVLARGLGKIIATADQLVKVGIAKDQACQLEGVLKSVVKQREEMERQLLRTEAREHQLRAELGVARTIPFKNPFAMVPQMMVPQNRQERPVSVPLPGENALIERASNGSAPPPIFSPGTPSASRLVMESPNSRNGRLFCMSMPESAFENADNTLALPNLGSFGEMSPSAFAPQNQAISSSPTRGVGVNFRTGLSGHSALTSASSHAARQDQARRQTRLMGEHKGIAKIKQISHCW